MTLPKLRSQNVRDVTSRRLVLAACLLAGAIAWRAGGSEPVAYAKAAAPQDKLAQQAYTVLKTYCFECHGAPKRSGLDMRTHESITAGGANGKVIVPHDPGKSKLYLYASYEADKKMPPSGKIPEADLDTLRAWIEAGGSLQGVEEAAGAAKNAAELAKAEERPIKPEERQYWAFKPPVRAAIPAPKTPGWGANPIDAFLASAMEAKGAKPSAAADPRTLIRRAYLDMLGLPPTPEEVEAFVNDKSPEAWSKVIDAVLASPHYGERWARHWMDLVRYADSEGFEFDNDRQNMYRYRDYLVDAFNKDKPYDQFVKEQLAGDEYAPVTDEAMIATGFLRLGPSGGGTRQDALDDLVAASAQTFMGMTVNCARCHNHKFDPIPQKDYYRIQAIFAPTSEVAYPLAPPSEAETNRKETQRIDGLQRPLRQEKTKIEAPYLQMIVDREIAKLPEYMQIAWKTPPDQRTTGQKLTVIQIERTVTPADTTRKLVNENDLVVLMPEDVKAKHAEVKAQIATLDKQKPRPMPTALAIGERGRVPAPTYFLHRGSPDSPGSAMAPGVLSVASQTDWAFPEPPAGREVELPPPRVRRVADLERESADRAGDGQSALAAPLRRRHRPHAEQFRQDGGAAVASGTARLAGARVRRSRLELEADAQAHVDVARLSDGEHGSAGQRQRRSRKPPVLARAARAARSGSDSRRDHGRDRRARSDAWRPIDLPVHRS